jgi:hypothetical protein
LVLALGLKNLILWSGNQKARVIDAKQTNKYVLIGEEAIDAQATIYQSYK